MNRNDEPFLQHFFSTIKLSPDELDLIISSFKKVDFKKNDFLLKEGMIENQYWILESGVVRSYAIDTLGNDITTNFFTVGEIVIDWSSFFLRNQSRENIQALADCKCWQLDYESFQKLFNEVAPFRDAGRARLVNSYFELKKNSISMIVDTAKQRYLRLIKEKPLVIQKVSLKQIATFLGVTDTSLSRIRKELSSE